MTNGRNRPRWKGGSGRFASVTPVGPRDAVEWFSRRRIGPQSARSRTDARSTSSAGTTVLTPTGTVPPSQRRRTIEKA